MKIGEITEYDEITLKKIIKGKMIDEFYINLNVLLRTNNIKNNELSEKIGWDSAGYNQKLNRKNDLRLTTLINIFAAIMDLVNEKNAIKVSFYERYEIMDYTMFFSLGELRLGELFLHISSVVKMEEEFLNTPERIKTYKSLKSYVLGNRQSPRLSEQEKEVYLKFYNLLP